jgi:hypothetical protein
MIEVMFMNKERIAPAMKRREFLISAGTCALTTVAEAQQNAATSNANFQGVRSTTEQHVNRPGLSPVTFIGGQNGGWKISRMTSIIGDPLPMVENIDVQSEIVSVPVGAWALRGVAGHVRYVERKEKGPLDTASPALGRPEATKAVLIPIRKTVQWWTLPQDERRAIFEERSHHIADSMRYLPRIARRLYHSRDLGEPYDFLTWFEFAPEHTQAFDELLAMLRSREEWTYVDRETEIRLER